MRMVMLVNSAVLVVFFREVSATRGCQKPKLFNVISGRVRFRGPLERRIEPHRCDIFVLFFALCQLRTLMSPLGAGGVLHFEQGQGSGAGKKLCASFGVVKVSQKKEPVQLQRRG